MRKKFLLLVAAGVLASPLALYRCGSNKVVPDVCFSKNILPIFVSKCTTSGCHSGGSGRGKGDGSDFRTYEGIVSKVKPYHPLLSEVYTKCNGSNPEMPPSGNTRLTDTELAYIKYWIHSGAKQTDCSSNACDTSSVTYAARIQPLLNSWCVGCHNAGNAGGGYDFSNYQGAKAAVTSARLIGSLKQQTGFNAMPQGSGPLSTCDIRAFEIWVAAGCPNN